MSAGDSSHPHSIFGAPGVMPISACMSRNARTLQERAQSKRKFFLKSATNIIFVGFFLAEIKINYSSLVFNECVDSTAF